MIATIDGITVMGTPEEIKRYKEISEGKKQNPIMFTLGHVTQVPDHVKKYKSHPGWHGNGPSNAWY